MGREAYTSLDASIPASRIAAITPSDSANFEICRGFYTGTGGTIVVIAADDGAPQTLNSVAGGIIMPIQIKRVLATGTTATGLLALY